MPATHSLLEQSDVSGSEDLEQESHGTGGRFGKLLRYGLPSSTLVAGVLIARTAMQGGSIKSHFLPTVDLQEGQCCLSMNADCMSCREGLTVADLCFMVPTTEGCDLVEEVPSDEGISEECQAALDRAEKEYESLKMTSTYKDVPLCEDSMHTCKLFEKPDNAMGYWMCLPPSCVGMRFDQLRRQMAIRISDSVDMICGPFSCETGLFQVDGIMTAAWVVAKEQYCVAHNQRPQAYLPPCDMIPQVDPTPPPP